jgi:GT2 family glycosyltransferase
MTIAVLIVNWNGGALLARCLESMRRQERRPDQIVVVDNASTDDSLEQAAHVLVGAQVIRLDENAGFARANNLAAQAARQCDAFALLNPDAIAEPDWLAALVEAAERRPDVASFASRMVLADAPNLLDGAGDSYHVSGRAWRNGHQMPAGDWPAREIEVFGPCAAAALYRSAPFMAIGGFDERFFCYFEDIDLAFRLRLQGHRCLYVDGARVAHVGSASSGYQSDFAVYHGERNAVWTFVKDMPGWLFWLYLPQHLALNLASLLYYPWRGQGRVVLKAKVDAMRGLPAIVRQRRAVQAGRRAAASDLQRAMRRGVLDPYIRRYSPA